MSKGLSNSIAPEKRKPRVALKRGYLMRKYGGEIFQSTSSNIASVPTKSGGKCKTSGTEQHRDQSNFLMFSNLLIKTQHQLVDSFKPVELNSPEKTIEGIRKSLIDRFKKNNESQISDTESCEPTDEILIEDKYENPVLTNEPAENHSFSLNYNPEDALPFIYEPFESLLNDGNKQQQRPETVVLKPTTMRYSDAEVFQIDSPGYKAFIEEHDFTENMPTFFNDLSS